MAIQSLCFTVLGIIYSIFIVTPVPIDAVMTLWHVSNHGARSLPDHLTARHLGYHRWSVIDGLSQTNAWQWRYVPCHIDIMPKVTNIHQVTVYRQYTSNSLYRRVADFSRVQSTMGEKKFSGCAGTRRTVFKYEFNLPLFCVNVDEI